MGDPPLEGALILGGHPGDAERHAGQVQTRVLSQYAAGIHVAGQTIRADRAYCQREFAILEGLRDARARDPEGDGDTATGIVPEHLSALGDKPADLGAGFEGGAPTRNAPDRRAPADPEAPPLSGHRSQASRGGKAAFAVGERTVCEKFRPWCRYYGTRRAPRRAEGGEPIVRRVVLMRRSSI